MKILLYCYAFSPSIGGIETLTETLARNIVKLGYECTVVTETLSEENLNFPFNIIRSPSLKNLSKLIGKVDVVCNIELSMKFFFLSKLASKPLIWVHNGYKLMCIDALGWFGDGPAPIDPWQSFFFYKKKKGLVFSLREGAKLFARRWAANNIYCNVACSKWVDKRQPLKNQVQLYTPYPIERFIAVGEMLDKKYDFMFVGRLVPEKGVDTLLYAFQDLMIKTRNYSFKLAIVGYGAAEGFLKELSSELNLNGNVFFLGPKMGNELLKTIVQTEIAVIPSYWEEPLGGISLELMAAGRIVIVSKNGGMTECIGEAGLTFTNGNWKELSQKMQEAWSNIPAFKESSKEMRKAQINKFEPEQLTHEFIKLFKNAKAKKSGKCRVFKG